MYTYTLTSSKGMRSTCSTRFNLDLPVLKTHQHASGLNIHLLLLSLIYLFPSESWSHEPNVLVMLVLTSSFWSQTKKIQQLFILLLYTSHHDNPRPPNLALLPKQHFPAVVSKRLGFPQSLEPFCLRLQSWLGVYHEQPPWPSWDSQLMPQMLRCVCSVLE
jgi:hypothetical protein